MEQLFIIQIDYTLYFEIQSCLKNRYLILTDYIVCKLQTWKMTDFLLVMLF